MAISSKLFFLRMAFDIIIYYPSEERMLNSKKINQSKGNVIIYIIFSLNNIITITYYILCFQQIYKEGLGIVGISLLNFMIDTLFIQVRKKIF